MRVLVTGAAGSLGRRVSTALCERGVRVVGHDRGPCPDVLGGVVERWIEADLRTGTPPLAGIDAVVHLAAIAGIAAEADPDATRAINTGTTAALLEAARETNTRVVLASSIAAIGTWEADRPAPDDAALRPVSAYGSSKVEAEAMIRAAAADGVAACALRLPTLLVRAEPRTGPPTTGFLSDIANALLRTGEAHSPMPADFAVAVAGLAEAVAALARLAVEPLDEFPPVVNLPAFPVTPARLADAVSRVRPGSRLVCAEAPDPAILRAAGSWPSALVSDHGAWLLAERDPAARLARLVAARAAAIVAEA